MLSYPLRTKSRSLKDWYATQPDQFTRERSPKKTTFWLVVLIVGVVLTAVVYLNPDEVRDLLGGSRRRGGMAVLGAFVIPPALIVVGLVFQFLNAHRFRLNGGGVLRTGELFIVPGQLDVSQAVAAFESGQAGRERQREAIAFLDKHQANAELQTGQQIVVIEESPKDRVAFLAVLRMDAHARGLLWLDRPPTRLAGDDYLDIRALRRDS